MNDSAAVLPAAATAGPPIEDVLGAVRERPLLQDRVVILTGAAGGIGRVLARVLAEAGARLAVLDLSADVVEELTVELQGRAHSLLAQAVDVADPGGFERAHERVRAELGPVDGLVNCAGLWAAADFDEVSDEQWSTMLEANLNTTFVTCRAVLPAMIERRSGSVVNFASTAGEYGSISPAVHYAAAKGGVIALTKSLAREVSPFNVRVNALSPGPTNTPSLVGTATAEQRAEVGARTLLGRLGEPHEIAGACVFLLSPLSTFVTGHVLGVNGGSLL